MVLIMSAITQEFIDESQREVESLSNLLAVYTISSLASMAYITLRSTMIYVDSKILLTDIIKSTADSSEIIDDSGSVVDRLLWIQEKIKENYKLMQSTKLPFLFSAINQGLHKKAFHNFGMMIININEHDVDAENSY